MEQFNIFGGIDRVDEPAAPDAPKVISTDARIIVPKEVAVCPICGADVVVEEIDEIEANEAGEWVISEHGLHLTCKTEPGIDEEVYEDWFSGHFSTPYMDWLPLEDRVREWLNKNYRFKRED